MPYNYKYKTKYSSAQKKVYLKNKKRKAKSYRNREQRLSILTVKAIAKKACTENVEVKRKMIQDNTKIVGYHLGHPALHVPGENWGAGNNAQYNGRPFVKKIFDALEIEQGKQSDQRIGDQILLKGFWIRYKFKQPINIDAQKIPMNWYKVTMMIVRANKGINPKLTQFTNHFYEDPVVKRKMNPAQELKVISKKVITFRPRVSCNVSIGTATAVYKPSTANEVAVLQFPVAPAGQTGRQPTVCTSSQKTVTGSWYVKINKKINCYTTALHQANINPYQYWIIIYSLQPNLSKSTADKLYTNNFEDSGVHGYGKYNVQGNHIVTALFTDQ